MHSYPIKFFRLDKKEIPGYLFLFHKTKDETMGSQEHNLAVLGQIVKHIPGKLIEKLKAKYKIQTRAFSATSHVVAMIFAQLSHALSLNDICDCLHFRKGYLAQIRDCVPPSRNGLAHANATRNAGLAEELFWTVLAGIKEKYPQFISGGRHYPGLPWRFRRAIHVVDSTTIQLIAKCMNWAKHREQKAAAKMHLDLDLKSFLPNFAIVNRAKDSDPKMAWALCEPIRAGEIVVFDKAYVDFAHLHHLHQKGVIWVSRAKENVCFEVMGQQLSEEEMQQAQHMYEAGIFMGQQPIVLSDCRIKLAKDDTYARYPDEIRMIDACVLQDGKPCLMKFITNQFVWSAYSICELYLARWGIEVFFKEIKQTLQLADFLGTSENAIKWQIWTALLTYLLLRLNAWLGGWKRSFRRFFTLVKGVLWSQRRLSTLIFLIENEEQETSPPIRLSAVQMQFDFGDI